MKRLGLGFLVCMAACGGPDGADLVQPPPGPGVASIVEVVSGDRQVDTVARQLPLPVRVRVMDANRAAIRGQLVNFVVVQGGGQVFAGSALTDDSGEAVERWTLGTAAGQQAMEARAVDQTTGDPIVFARVTATAEPGPAATLTLRRSDTLAFLGVGTDLRGLVASVKDQYDNPVPNPVYSVTGTGTYTAAGSIINAAGEGDWSLQLRADNAATTLAVHGRRDLVALLTGRTATWGCRGGSGRIMPTELLNRHGILEWIWLQSDVTARVDSVRYGVVPNQPAADGLISLTTTLFGRFRAYQGTLEDTLTIVDNFQPHWFRQRPDSLLWRNSALISINASRWNGVSHEGGDWCPNSGSFDSFIPLVIQ